MTSSSTGTDLQWQVEEGCRGYPATSLPPYKTFQLPQLAGHADLTPVKEQVAI